MWIFPVIFLVVILLIVFRGGGSPMSGGRGTRTHDREESTKEILDRRYARGEIGQEEYQRMKKDLE